MHNFVFNTDGNLCSKFKLQEEIEKSVIQKHLDQGHTVILRDTEDAELVLSILRKGKDPCVVDSKVVEVEPLPQPEDEFTSYSITGIQLNSEGLYEYTYDTEITTPPPEPTWDDFDLQAQINSGISYPNALRNQRNYFLELTDKIIVDPDLTDAKKTEWNTYRQELRDLPAQAGWPDNITWPTRPTE